MVHQMVRSSGFGEANPHLSAGDVARLRLGRPVWPDCPVYSPYAVTHDGYSQIRYNNIKYLMHRVTYKSHYGQLSADLEVSHLLWLGLLRTAR